MNKEPNCSTPSLTGRCNYDSNLDKANATRPIQKSNTARPPAHTVHLCLHGQTADRENDGPVTEQQHTHVSTPHTYMYILPLPICKHTHSIYKHLSFSYAYAHSKRYLCIQCAKNFSCSLWRKLPDFKRQGFHFLRLKESQRLEINSCLEKELLRLTDHSVKLPKFPVYP